MAKEKQRVCPICNKKLTFLKSTLKDGVKVCAKHVVTEAGLVLTESIEQSTVEDIKQRIELLNSTQEEIKKEADSFSATKKIGNFVAFDDEQKKWAILNTWSGEVLRVFDYSDIVDFELLEDGESVASGGLGRALAGGALFGGVGAIVGGVTGKRRSKEFCGSLKLKVTINDINNPVIYVSFIDSKTKKAGSFYKIISESAQECLSTFQLICDKQKEGNKENDYLAPSPMDDIREFKKLLDEGIITQEDFDAKKKELLGL